MSHEEAFDRAVEDDHFDLFVSFERRNDLIELGNGVGTKDVERRMINRYSPIMGRAPRKMYLLHARCVESFEPSGIARGLDSDLRAKAPDELRLATPGGQHSAEKEQIAGLHRFHVSAERLGRPGELDTKLLQPLFGAGRRHSCGMLLAHRGFPS